jgi:virginiamycin B lyase
MKRLALYALSWLLFSSLCAAEAKELANASLSGVILDSSGQGIGGVMVSAIDEEQRKWTSVFSRSDGSFRVEGLRSTKYRLRSRLNGLADEWISGVEIGDDVRVTMRPATGKELEAQRPASDAFGMLKFDHPRDKMNFKMMCSYCHQVGTLGFRTPEEPVDWETMIRRMDGFGGLYQHTQETIVRRLMETYKDDAVDRWPTYIPPPAPAGLAAAATITMWELDEPLQGSFHDLEIGRDGLVYAVNISKHRMTALDPVSGEQTIHKFPPRTYGPHSIETANDGSLWTTMCASGQMIRFDIETKEFETYSSAEAPKKRGNYPHTLRINPEDPEGLIWYTDAGSNSCFSIHPTTHVVKEYPLLSAGQAAGAGRGESRGVTPYGLDFSPVDGMIWYSKLNGNRIGRIDPNTDDGDIREWNPPFRGPRRLHVAPDGMVWVPGFGSGVFGKFDPTQEIWTVYELPDAENQIPYALNVDQDGIVWICGTGNDTINRFDPETETLVEFRLPTRVSYTREIEFDDDGNVWTSTSGPARHMERGSGAVIKITLPKSVPADGGVQLTAVVYDSEHSVGNLATAPDSGRQSNLTELFVEIGKRDLPEAYVPKRHQIYVDAVLEGMPENRRSRVGQMWNQFRQLNPERKNDGQMFVRILDYLATDPTAGLSNRRFVKKWQHHYFGDVSQALEGRSLTRGKSIFEQATCSRCHAIGGQGERLGPELTDIAKRFQGSKLIQQMVKPSSEIHKDFKTELILVDDGRLLTGVVIEETEEEVHVLTNMLKPDKVDRVAKDSIEDRKVSELSTMPVGLLDTFTLDEILDLAAYLQSGGASE